MTQLEKFMFLGFIGKIKISKFLYNYGTSLIYFAQIKIIESIKKKQNNSPFLELNDNYSLVIYFPKLVFVVYYQYEE